MKLRKILLTTGAVLMTASNALAAEFENSGNFLSNAAAGLDSTLQPFGEVVASNIPLIFKLIMGAAILLFAVLATVYKNRGRSGQAAEYRAGAWDVFTTAIIAVCLFSVFSGVCKMFGV